MTLSTIKKLIAGSLVAAMAPFLQGCDERDAAMGVGLVAIGAGIVAIGSAADDDDDDYRRHRGGGYYEECSSYRDRWGDRRRDCRRGHHGGGYGRYRGYSLQANNSTLGGLTANIQQQQTQTVEWAKHYKMSFDSADMLLTALNQSRQGSFAGLQQLGFVQRDVESLARMEMPTSQGIKNLSTNLNQAEEDTTAMVKSLVAEARKQATDVNSPMWKQCMAAGKWKTPQNVACSKDFWNGCSPATGATACVPAAM